MKNVLFICSANKLRSPTAENVFSKWPDIETDSAGISNDADVMLSREQVSWANIIFVMEKTHKNRLQKKFKDAVSGKRLICLGIPDDYEYMDPELVTLLENKVAPFLR
jgi:predicted protein tyrosine phosphatase